MGEDAPGISAAGIQFSVPATNELPRHKVCVSEFWLGRTEVTRAQWRSVMDPLGQMPPRREQAATDVSWRDAQRYVSKLSANAPPVFPRRIFRLPTEAEWEYACRAGARSPAIDVHSVDGEVVGALERWTVAHAWYAYPVIRDRWANDVAKKQPNAWGIYDMLGNVLEWTEDAYRESGYLLHTRMNPKVTVPGDAKVARGGSFRSPLERVRCGARFTVPEDDFTPVTGLRVVMEIKEQK